MYGVYTDGLERARGNPFSYDGNQGLTIEDGTDAKRLGPGLAQQGGQGVVVESMQDTMTYGFVQTPKVMEDALRLCAELILVRQPEVSSVEGRKVRVRMKRRKDETPLRMENPDPLANRGMRRVNEGQ